MNSVLWMSQQQLVVNRVLSGPYIPLYRLYSEFSLASTISWGVILTSRNSLLESQ